MTDPTVLIAVTALTGLCLLGAVLLVFLRDWADRQHEEAMRQLARARIDHGDWDWPVRDV